MIERKVVSLAVNFFNRPFKTKEPPTSGGIIYVNKLEDIPSQEDKIKTMRIFHKAYHAFNNGFNNHKK
jgi:hypothetical protein